MDLNIIVHKILTESDFGEKNEKKKPQENDIIFGT